MVLGQPVAWNETGRPRRRTSEKVARRHRAASASGSGRSKATSSPTAQNPIYICPVLRSSATSGETSQRYSVRSGSIANE